MRPDEDVYELSEIDVGFILGIWPRARLRVLSDAISGEGRLYWIDPFPEVRVTDMDAWNTRFFPVGGCASEAWRLAAKMIRDSANLITFVDNIYVDDIREEYESRC